MKQYYSLNINTSNVKNALTIFLKEQDIYYEVSSLYPNIGYHFEILCDLSELKIVNSWLDDHLP